jgi:methyl-accepting chemotaxis protein
MDVKMDVNLRSVQEQVGDGVQQVQTVSNRALLAYVGLWGLGFDFAKEAIEAGKDLIDRAELRGEDMVRELNDQLGTYTSQATDEVKKVADAVNSQVEGVSGKITDNTKSLEQEVEKILARVGFSRSDVAATVIEVQEELNSLVEPFPGYNELTVKEIVTQFDDMNDEDLLVVRVYEAGTKKRVTILREVDERLGVTT